MEQIKDQCINLLQGYNEHFKENLYIRKIEDDEKHDRLVNLLRYCKQLNVHFEAYLRIWKCVPAETWKMYDLLELEGLQEQVALKKAKDNLLEYVKLRPKLIVKGRLSNDRKKTIRKITERNNSGHTESGA
jgi:hypothetical protein